VSNDVRAATIRICQRTFENVKVGAMELFGSMSVRSLDESGLNAKGESIPTFDATSRARRVSARRETRGQSRTGFYLSNAIEIVSNDARAATIRICQRTFRLNPSCMGKHTACWSHRTFFGKDRFSDFDALSCARHDSDRRETRGQSRTNNYLSNAIEIVSNDAQAATIRICR